ncbi:alpha-amylase family glycosyl hydrolase [Bacteroides sp. UBA939]|uniref:DUF4961 domain-containing protein n=1 Tax=Bacteroides sp. UBA939 TaxID=1946092 RepID=UPI0025BA949C|nr:alpha-amylase family glycosyl hydrolase [Bacteroides sp. UBA939]
MRRLYSLLTCLLAIVSMQAQIVTTTPAFPTENDEVTIIFDATKGTAGLKSFTGDVYAHTGVITNKSAGGSDWKYAVAGWAVNLPKAKMTRLGNDKWELKITPNIRAYYGVPASETIKQMAFVFRSSDGTKEGKDTGATDIFVEVHTAGLTVRFDQPSGKDNLTTGTALTIQASASAASTLKLFVGSAEIATENNVTTISKSYTFTEGGNYTLKAEATANGNTVSVTQEVSVLKGTSTSEAMPGGVRPGINYISDTEATLVLQAPHKKYVYVVGDFNDWTPVPESQLKQDGEYFWITLTGLEKGKEYAFQYLVDGSVYVADPYTDKVLDPWNDSYIDNATYPNLKVYPTGKAEGIVSVLQTDQTSYNWQVKNFERPASDQLIIYEMLIRDFTKEHTFNAAKDKLTYLKELGINAVELMPVNEFEGNSSWGYNPSFYFAVDKYYGTKNDLKAFVDECHKQGMAVIIDLVLNHSFGQSPFYLLYRDADGKPSVNNPWYNKESNIKNPGLSWGYDFNHDSEYTKALVDSVASFWMSEYKIDGFRYDFTKGFSNTPYGVNDWANGPDEARITNLKRITAAVQKRQPGAYVIFEHLAAADEEKRLAEDGILLWRNENAAYCESAMGWKSSGGSNTAFTGIYAGTGMPAGSLVGYMESHDEERMGFKAWKWGNTGVIASTTSVNNAASPTVSNNINLNTRMKRLATNAAFFLTVPGPKMVWQFGELGYDFSINNNSTGSQYNADGAYRTDPKPIRWDYFENADRKKLYDTYAALLDLRHSYPELFASNASFSWKATNADWDNGRTLTATTADGTKSLVIVGNFTLSDKSFSVTFPKVGNWYEVLKNNELLSITSTGQTLTIPAHEFRLLTNFIPTLTGIEMIAPDAGQPLVYYNKRMDTLVLPAGEAKRIEVYSVNGMLVMAQENCTSVGLSALPAGCYMARAYMEDGGIQVCKIMK